MVDKPVRNNEDQLLLNQKAKKEHYENLLLNFLGIWRTSLRKPMSKTEMSQTQRPSAIIASGKAAGPSGTITKILKSLGKTGTPKVPDLVDITTDSCIPSDWH